ncbi:MAG: family 78 glycoside hydrolase catalytic domain, partial [Verrucomicrobia bacterium]|nr:family 78 glycoside hydrolase catalytic domain [Verrucomicrobiota bacterium]
MLVEGRHVSAPLFRREFGISGEMKRARVYISGLGWNELHINGNKVGDHVLDPATTYYHNDQPFELGSRILYVTHDVTDFLRKGKNTIGVMLGNGWYSNDEAVLGKDVTGRQSFGTRPILRLQMNVEYTDGRVESIVTDDKWKVSDGPITANEICLGEAYDARLAKTGWDSPGHDDSKWDNAVGVKIPGGRMVAQIMPPVKVMRTMKPVKITRPAEGVYIYDFGQHFSGWTRLRVEGPRGTKVTIRHAGILHDDGRLDIRNLRQAGQTDTYILKGEGIEDWEPRFTLHGF